MTTAERATTDPRLEALAKVVETRAVPANSSRDRSSDLLPLAVVLPRSLDEVAGVLSACRALGLSVNPVSTGRNWGYTTRQATAEAQVLLDLGHLRTISAFDAALGVVTLEPGVTQGELAAFLAAQGDEFYADMTAAGPDTSVVGNLCDRGFGNSPLGNRAASVLGFDVLLADGRRIATDAHALFPGDASTKASFTAGPLLTSLFVQSNFGIVLRARIQLNRRGSTERVIGLETSEAGLPALIGRIARLKQSGALPGCIHLANDLRLLSNVMRFPRATADDLRPLTAQEREHLADRHGFSPWTGFTLLAGPGDLVKGQARAIKRGVRRRGQPAVKVRILRPRLIAAAARILAPRLARLPGTRRLADKLRRASMLFETLRGSPSAEVLYNTGWRLVDAPATAPTATELDQGRVGILWYAPSFPLLPDRVEVLLALATPIFARHGFDMLVMITCITERMGCAVFNILYDPAQPAESAAAQSCLTELTLAGLAQEFMPYRLPSMLWPWLRSVHPDRDIWDKLKTALDPDGVIAPGRYGIGGPTTPES